MPAAPVLVRNVDHLDAGAPCENLGVEVREAADAGAGVAELAGVLLGVGDQVRTFLMSKFAVVVTRNDG